MGTFRSDSNEILPQKINKIRKKSEKVRLKKPTSVRVGFVPQCVGSNEAQGFKYNDCSESFLQKFSEKTFRLFY